MHKNYLRNFIAVILSILLLSGCEGSGVIEADDFGEYDTDKLAVNSQSANCTIDFSRGMPTATNPNLQSCVNKGINGKIAAPSYNCDVGLWGKNVFDLYHCISGDDTGCLDNYTISGDSDYCSSNETETRKEVLKDAAMGAFNDCELECLAGNKVLEPDWVSNLMKSDDSELGITITPSNRIDVQALGGIALISNSSIVMDYNLPKQTIFHELAGEPVVITKDIPTLSLEGWMCLKGGKSQCAEDDQVGEFNNKLNVSKRESFLRRGVVILQDLPEGGSITPDEKYIGPLLQSDTTGWNCRYSFNESAFSETENIEITKDYTCLATFDDDNFKSYNEQNYQMEHTFVKKVGGLVIPNNVREYILNNPFGGFNCSTEEDQDGNVTRKCGDGLLPSFTITTTASSRTTTQKFQNAYILSRKGRKEINMLYPTKLAFRIVKNQESKGNISGTCKVIVSVVDNNEIQELELLVNADDNWHFLIDNSNEQVLLGKDRFHTVKRLTSSTEQNINTQNQYKVNILIDDTQTWTDENGKAIPCGEGLVAFFMPQNEVYVDKSGFVSFRNYLANNMRKCSSTDGLLADGEVCANDLNLKFTIINPAIVDLDGATELEKGTHFYEYELSYMKPQYQEINLITFNADSESFSGKNTWSNRVFVRKGQILRFPETNWFDITSVGNNSYTIKTKKSIFHDLFVDSPMNGLVMHIDERPALLCRGTAPESIDNADCKVAIDSEGNKYCQLDYSTKCGDEKNKENYCPFGCAYDTGKKDDDGNPTPWFVDDKYTGNCSITYDDLENMNKHTEAQVTLESCKKCQKKLKENALTPTSEENVIQCYNLEDYIGAVRNLLDLTDTKPTNDVYQYGSLTERDLNLGAKKLESFFDNFEMGNLVGMYLDDQYKTTADAVSQVVYLYNNNISITDPKIFKFLVLDNEDFIYSNMTNNTDKVNGNYHFSLTPDEYVYNGENLAIVLADKNWNPKTDGYIEGGKFKAWIVKYNYLKEENKGYGQLASDSPYYFNDRGILVDKSGQPGVDMSTISPQVQGVNEDGYKDLRFFFKIIDKEDRIGCGGSKMYTRENKTVCKCEGEDNNAWRDCKTISCGDKDIESTTDNSTCQDIYYDNIGSYSVQLQSPKDIAASTSVIVKYIMEPILEILDGRTIGIAVDNYGNPMPCQTTNHSKTYGGILPKDKVGERCNPNEVSLYTNYCFMTTKYCGGTDAEPIYCYLPGANIDQIGDSCSGYSEVDGRNYCFSTPNDKCVIYRESSGFSTIKDDFGESCDPGDKNCYRDCSTLDINVYASHCKVVNNGRGFLQTFYIAVVTDTTYQILLKLCFTLMFTFYGLYFLLGLSEMTYTELIKKSIKISFIYLMVGEKGWYYYNMFFVKFFKGGVDYIVFAVASSFDDSASLASAFVKNNFYDKSVLFSGVDKNLSLIFADKTTFKIWGLFFVSFFGWLYVILIYSGLITYITTVAHALLLYLTAQFFISFLLCFGPVFFVLLVFDRTKSMFDNWVNSLVGLSFQQIFLLTCLSLFNSLVYVILKFVLSYKVAWRPIWVINLPIIGKITLLYFWKATASNNPSAAANAIPGLFQVLLIYLISELMESFMQLMTDLGGSIAGGAVSASGMSADIKKFASGKYNAAAGAVKNFGKSMAEKLAKRTVGYETQKEEEAREKNEEQIKKGRSNAEDYAEQSVEDYKKNHASELVDMSKEDREKKLAGIYKDAYNDHLKNDSATQDALKAEGITEDDFKKGRNSNMTTLVEDALPSFMQRETIGNFIKDINPLGNTSDNLDKRATKSAKKNAKLDKRDLESSKDNAKFDKRDVESGKDNAKLD